VTKKYPPPTLNNHVIDTPDPPGVGGPVTWPVNPNGCTITATGHATGGSVPLATVKGLVLRSGSPSSPPPGSVVGTINPNKIDYSFSAVPGAINGEPNRLGVWAEFSGDLPGTPPAAAFRDFKGSGGGSGCDPQTGGGGGVSKSTPLFRAAPRFVRVRLDDDWVHHTAPDDEQDPLRVLAGDGLVLRYDVRRGTPAIPLWSSSGPADERAFWSLRVARVDDALRAALDLLHVLQTGGERLCRWMADGWSFTRRNRLIADPGVRSDRLQPVKGPAEAGHYELPPLCVEPA